MIERQTFLGAVAERKFFRSIEPEVSRHSAAERTNLSILVVAKFPAFVLIESKSTDTL